MGLADQIKTLKYHCQTSNRNETGVRDVICDVCPRNITEEILLISIL